MRWFVYALIEQDVITYIGKGSGSRHLVSQRERGGIAKIIQRFRLESQALKAEKRLIAKYTPGLNKTKGGEGRSKDRISDEAREEAIVRKWKRDCYREADQGWLVSLFAALGYARIDKDKDRFIRYLKRIKNFPKPNHPIALIVWESAQAIPYSVAESV